MTIEIRLAAPADAPRLSAFAAEAFRDTFGPDNTPADMDRYVAESFTTERQAAEIEEARAIVLLAELADAASRLHLAGYAHLVAGEAPPAAVTGPDPIELKRFYVGRRWHGRGVAQALMKAALSAAEERGGKTVWLGVWERNPRAVAFYRKFGFVRVGEQTFVLGEDRQTDWLLVRALGDAAPPRME